jgi:hypothetical protein
MEHHIHNYPLLVPMSQIQERIYNCEGPRAIIMRRPLSVATNLGYSNSFVIIIIIISYNNLKYKPNFRNFRDSVKSVDSISL